MVCPLCEHAQELGDECEVCGHRLAPSAAAGAPPGPADAAIRPLEGLEPTGLAPYGAPEPIPSLLELEPTGVVAGAREADVAAGPALELEPARAAPVDIAVEPLPGLEPSREGIPEAARTPLAAVLVCRYCRTPALPGERRCARCGMRLPLIEPARAASAPAPEDMRRCSCGAPAVGARCPACGARNPGALEG